MIVTSTEIIRNYITVNASFTYENARPKLKTAERDFLKTVIGKEQIAVFSATELPQDAIVLEALELAQEAICNYAFYLSLPELSVQISDAGLFTSTTQDATPAKANEKNDLLRSFLNTAYKALDALLELFEENADKFTAFYQSSQYTKYASLLVNKTSVFNDYFTIDNSMMTYLKLRPELIIVEDQFIESVVQKSVLEALKTPQTYAVRKEVKKLLQQACVAFCVYKVLDNGAYRFNGDSIVMKFDMLPWEQIKQVSGEHIQNSKNNKFSEGNNYLSQAKKLILDNLTDFSEYVAPTERTPKEMIKKNGGIASL